MGGPEALRLTSPLTCASLDMPKSLPLMTDTPTRTVSSSSHDREQLCPALLCSY